jgi:ketosteroid isomerase-like protein
MRVARSLLVMIFVLLSTSSFAWAAGDLRAAMEAANTDWLAAYNGLNGKAFPAMYASDAVVLPPGAQPINGAEAIGQFWSDRIKAGNRKNHTFEIVSIERDGKYAYQVSRWTLDVVKDNGDVTKLAGNTVRVFEEQPDGKWLTKVHIFNVY